MTPDPDAARVLEEIERNHSPDHWYDVELGDVGALLSAASPAAWDDLERSASALPAPARRRLAEALLVPEGERATRLLITLLGSSEAEVGAAVAATLLGRGYRWEPGVDIGPDLRRHLAGAPADGREELERLLALVG